MEVSYSGGTDTNLFTYNTNFSTEIDRFGWKQSQLSVNMNTAYPFGHNSEIDISPSAVLFLGHFSASSKQAESRLNQLKATNSQAFFIRGQRLGEFESADLTNVLYTNPQILIAYAKGSRIYNNRNSRNSFMIGLAPYYTYNATLNGERTIQNSYDISFVAREYIPALIPIYCKEGFTYNLPTKIVAGLFDAGSVVSSFAYTYGYFPNFAFITAETVLFGMEIQKSIPLFEFLYVHDVRLSLCGTYGSNYNENTISDNLRITQLPKYINEIKEGNFSPYTTASLKLTLGGTPLNFGQFNSTKFNIYASGNLYISKSTVTPLFEWGFEGNF